MLPIKNMTSYRGIQKKKKSFLNFFSFEETFLLRVRLGLRFQNSDFKIYDLKKMIFKNAVKRLAKS